MIDGDLVIARGVTSYWGQQGPARDRFYAFNKTTGESVWASTPGVAPQRQFLFYTRARKYRRAPGILCRNRGW